MSEGELGVFAHIIKNRPAKLSTILRQFDYFNKSAPNADELRSMFGELSSRGLTRFENGLPVMTELGLSLFPETQKDYFKYFGEVGAAIRSMPILGEPEIWELSTEDVRRAYLVESRGFCAVLFGIGLLALAVVFGLVYLMKFL